MSNLDFIIAKVRGMRSTLYERERLSRLCDIPTLAGLAATLVPDKPLRDPIALQRELTARHVADLHRILVSLDGSDADLFLWLLRRYQVENLKIVLRSWAAKSGPAALQRYSVALPDELGLPAADLIAATGIEALLGQIPVPELREGALLGLDDYRTSARLFYVEAGIDRAYFAELKRLAERSEDPDRQTAGVILADIDIYNALLVLRGLFNYSIPFDKLSPFLAPLGTHVRLQTLKRFRDAPDLNTAALAIPPVLVHRAAGLLTADDVEAALWQNLCRLANRQFYTAVLGLGALVAFYYIKRVELANLIRISEYLRYDQHGDDIRPHLIGLPAPDLARSR